jgi:hypothetical protein
MRPRWLGGRVLVAAGAVGLTVALAQQSGQSSFTGSSTSLGNQVTASTNFCTTSGSQTLTADTDSFIDQANPTAATGGTATYLVVTPQSGAVRRTLIRFPVLPTIPSGCTMSATLRIFAESQTSGRTIGAYRADPAAPAWTEAGLNWDNQPAHLAPAATAVMPSTDRYVDWDVTTLVRTMYTAGSNGFVVRDQDETGAGAWQQFNSRSVATNKPVLVIAWS